MSKTHTYNLAFILLIILENLFLFIFYPYHITSQPVNSAGYFLVSLSIGIALIVKFYNAPALTMLPRSGFKRKSLLILLGLAALLLLNAYTIRVIKTVNYNDISDIITAIRLMARKYLSGQFPYDISTLKEININRISNYLPMHWLPYTIAEYFHFDYRTITFSIWCIGAAVIMYRCFNHGNLYLQIVTPLLLALTYIVMLDKYWTVVGATVETMVAGYYMLLMAAVNRKNSLFAGVAIGCCLLSRYYVVIWLPLAAFVLFVSGNRKYLFRTMAVTAAVICVLYIIPFLSKDWSALYHSLEDYGTLPYNEWHHTGADDLPIHLYAGVGFAYIAYEKSRDTDMLAGYKQYKTIYYSAMAITLLTLGVWYWFNRHRIDNRIFLLASFKIYLSVFLAFSLIPYVYLMVPANFISIAILAEQGRYRI